MIPRCHRRCPITSGFFKQPKTVVEVHEKLQSSYHCEVNRVSMALLRLHKKRALRKTSKTVGKRKQVAYVW
jgi:predicted transcriptional regulator